MIGGKMSRKERRTFTQDFKLDAAQLVLDQNYSVREAASQPHHFTPCVSLNLLIIKRYFNYGLMV